MCLKLFPEQQPWPPFPIRIGWHCSLNLRWMCSPGAFARLEKSCTFVGMVRSLSPPLPLLLLDMIRKTPKTLIHSYVVGLPTQRTC